MRHSLRSQGHAIQGTPAWTARGLSREVAFHPAGRTYETACAQGTVTRLPLLTPHSRDPDALVLRPPRTARDTSHCGLWAGKLGSHAAHHCFGTLGQLPHVQLNLWRVGVKGSGISCRVPLVSPFTALRVMTQLLS